MGFFNIEKENKNKQNTFFNQNPNMMGNNQVDNSYNNQNMMNQGMMNQGMVDYNNQGMMDYNNQGMMPNDMNFNQFLNNGMMQSDYNSNMMQSGYNSGMMNQGMMDYNNQGMMPNGYGQNMASNDYNPVVHIPEINPVDMPSISNRNMMNQDYNQDMMNQNFNQFPSVSGMDNYSNSGVPDYNYNQMSSDYSQMNNDYNQAVLKPSIHDNQMNNMSNTADSENEFNIDIPVLNRNQNNGIEIQNNDTNLGSEEKPSLFVETTPPTVPEPEVENPPTVPDKENHEDIETLEEPQLPREIEKEMELSSGSSAGKVEKKEEEKVPDNLNPLDNSSNPVPVNPIISEIEKHQDVEEIGEQKDVKANVFAAFGIIMGMIVKPGTTMINNSKKFKKMDKAISIMLWLSFLFLIICIGVRVLVGSFDRVYSSLTDTYKMVFNPARVFELSNYLEFIIITISLSIGGVMLVALIYYASSFINSKGVHFATYLIVSNLSMIPLIFGSIVLYPVAVIFSGYLAIGVLIFSFLATLITVLIGMNGVLKFKSVNVQIFYHVINLSIITLIAIIVFVFMIHSGWVVLPQMNI